MSITNHQLSKIFKPASGYTLIELLVTITIISILFLAGFASYREFSRRQAMLAAVRQVQGDLRLAQQLAISSKKPAVCTALDGYYFVSIPSSSYEIRYVCGATTGVEKAVAMPDGITISGLFPDLSPLSNAILFKTLGQGTNIPSGSPVGTGSTTITLTQVDTGTTSTVTITTGGQIK